MGDRLVVGLAALALLGAVLILVGKGLTGQNAAFTYMATPRRTVKVDFTYQPDPTQPGRELSTVMAGRNAWSATAQNCP